MLQAQSVHVKDVSSDSIISSLYDVVENGPNRYLSVGEHGAFAICELLTTEPIIHYGTFMDSTYNVEICNNGSLCTEYLRETKTHCTYACREHQGSIYLSTIKKDITHFKRVLPRGALFKLSTKDDTPKLIKQYTGSAIFHFFEYNNALYQIRYNLLGTKLECLSQKHKTKRFRKMLHKCFINDSLQLFCGSSGPAMRDGILIENGTIHRFKNAGMIWDVCYSNGFIFCAGSRGQLFYKKLGAKDFQLYNTGKQLNLYDICATADGCIVVGQQGTILILSIKAD